jgi:hypothetical protein
MSALIAILGPDCCLLMMQKHFAAAELQTERANLVTALEHLQMILKHRASKPK